MKIGVICYPKFGGSGVIATELGIAMAQRGHEIHFISYETPARLTRPVRNVHYHEVPVPTYPLFKYPPYALALASRIMAIVQDHGLDILHAHYAIPHTISALLARQMSGGHRFKIITTLHGTDIFLVGQEDSYQAITRYAIASSDGVTAVSNYLADYTVKAYEVEREIRVIPNFVDTERFNGDPARTQRSDFADDGEKILTHISNFRPIKRVCDIVRMFEIVQRKVPARLLMVGGGPDLTDAEQLSHRLGIDERVHFLGRREEVEEILAISDLSVMASEKESFGLAALEALSSSVPVIGTREGGFVEVVTDGETGYLCEVGAVEEMAAAAVRLLTNDELHAKFSAAGRRMALEKFPMTRITEQYEDYYLSVLEEADGARAQNSC